MAESTKYQNPPITEALIDFQFEASQDTKIDSLQSFAVSCSKEYPHANELQRSRIDLDLAKMKGGDSPTTFQRVIEGVRIETQDRKLVCQARLSGFTLSRLSPYRGWDELFSEAKRLWTLLVKAAKPVKVTRVAVRYINRIELPMPIADLSNFLQSVVVFPSGIDARVEGLFVRTQLGTTSPAATVLVSLATTQPPKPEVLPMVLDIDCFRVSDFGINPDPIWDFVAELRMLKNRVFEASITDQTRELFK